MRHVVEPQVLGQARGVQSVRVGQQQVRAAVGVPAGAHGAAVQPGEVGQQAGRARVVRGQPSPLLALAARPGLLLATGGRRLVQGIDGGGIRFSQMRVGVGCLRVSQLLVGRRKVGWWLVFGDSSMGEGRRGAVEMLPGGGEVRQARIPIAARVVAILGQRNGDPVSTKPRYCVRPAATALSLVTPGDPPHQPGPTPAGPALGPKGPGEQRAPGVSLSTATPQRKGKLEKDLEERALRTPRRRSDARGILRLQVRMPGLGPEEAGAGVRGESLQAAQSAVAHEPAHAGVVGPKWGSGGRE